MQLALDGIVVSFYDCGFPRVKRWLVAGGVEKIEKILSAGKLKKYFVVAAKLLLSDLLAGSASLLLVQDLFSRTSVDLGTLVVFAVTLIAAALLMLRKR